MLTTGDDVGSGRPVAGNRSRFIALALGLAFGLGGRETAAEVVRNWYGRSQEKSANIVKTAEAAGRGPSGSAPGMDARSGPT